MKTNNDCLWFMMNKMNMNFHKILCNKEISVHNENTCILQAPFLDDTASHERKRKKSLLADYGKE